MLARCRVDRPPLAVWTLPHALHEISGLARTAGGLLLAHGDEKGRIFALDERTGEVKRTFELEGLPRDDFEGIAVEGDTVYLMTSQGRIYVTSEGRDGGRVPYRVIETGLGRLCELEGLALDPRTRVLLLPCKVPAGEDRGGDKKEDALIFCWSLGTNALARPDRIVVERLAIKGLLGSGKFRQTGIEVDPGSGHLLSLSSNHEGLIEFSPDGKLLAAASLMPARHRQPEGLTLSADRLFISDEGGPGEGTITVYGCGP